ncbi:MAG: ribonuclease HII [Anaerolineae bacterium]|nr:ribonuclease HII [Anaerolineae bacterium]
MRDHKTASLQLERELIAQGYRCIVGIDEAGRGAWAGPVVAGAVVLPLERDDLPERLAGVYDSKQLTAPIREALVERIQSTALAWGVGRAEAGEIDALGIVPATCLAMRRAVEYLLASAALQPDFLLIDLIRWQGFAERRIPYRAVVRGDSRSLSIASASVLAKVTRDRWMIEYDAAYPQYGFAAHKGYGVARHQVALRDFGATPLHRMSYKPLAQLPLPFGDGE